MKLVLKFVICILLTGTIFFTACKKEKPVSSVVTPPPNPTSSNKPPVANAGADQTVFLPQDTVELNGTASYDPDGSITKFHWNKISGNYFFNISQPDSAKTVIQFLRLGEYVFQLEVTDNKGATSKATVKVIVKDNPAPTHTVKAKVLEYGTDLPVAGVILKVCTALNSSNDCGSDYLSLTTDANGECFFQANKFLYGGTLKDGYFGNIFMPCFYTYYRNDTLLDIHIDDYWTADSFIVRIVPKTDFTLHIVDSSLRGPDAGNYLNSEVIFNSCSIGGLWMGFLRRGIDTTIRVHSYYGNTTSVFTVGYDPDDGGFPMNVLYQQQRFIANGNNTIVNITY